MNYKIGGIKGKVSVIINCFNGERYLAEAVNSVLNQTYEMLELIVIDNCSEDSTERLIKKYGDALRYYKTPSHMPLYEARNFALRFVTGEFVAFLDADDVWYPEKLSVQLDSFPDDFSVVCANVKYIDEKSNLIGVNHCKLHSGWVTSKLLRENFIFISSVIIRTSVMKKELFNSHYNLLGDFNLWLRLSTTHKIASVDKYLLSYRVHESSTGVLEKGNWIHEMRENNIQFFKRNGLKYPSILILILRCELRSLFRRI